MMISASLVKELRERSGAGMMDCKKALTETNGDLEAAIDWLRKKGLSAAAKKSGRTAAEGLVGVYAQGVHGAICEVNAETDFVARNDAFKQYVRNVAQLALAAGDDLAKLKTLNYPGSNHTVEDELTTLIATIGENMTLRRAQSLTVPSGLVTSYIHNKVDEGLGRIGVLVALESSASPDHLESLGRQLAMHIAATAPQALTVEKLDPQLVEKERCVVKEQALTSGKPANVVDQMVEGRMKKFYKEVVLSEQAFVMDPDRSISQLIEDTGKSLGTDIKLKDFVRFSLGEGIEKKDEDFASEVAAQLNK